MRPGRPPLRQTCAAVRRAARHVGARCDDGQHWTERWARFLRPSTGHLQQSVHRRLPSPRPSRRAIHRPLAATRHASSVLVRRRSHREELSTPQSAVVIVQAGRLEAWKGHAALLDALGTLRDFPEWILWQVGGVQRPSEQTYLDSLRAHAARLGIADRVRFVGHRTDMPSVFAAADIQCQPNVSPEPFGLVFVEALAAGLPVVRTDWEG